MMGTLYFQASVGSSAGANLDNPKPVEYASAIHPGKASSGGELEARRPAQAESA